LSLPKQTTKKISTIQYLRARERLDRDWASFLPANEVRVLGWLMSMTLGWRNIGGDFSLRQMLRGIPNKEVPGELWVRGMGVSHYTLRKALKSLQRKGVLHVSWGSYGKKRYMINLRWSPATDGTRITSDDALPSLADQNRSANGEHGQSKNLAPDVQGVSDGNAENKHPYKAINTRQVQQARPEGRSLCSGALDDEIKRTVQDLQHLPDIYHIPVLQLSDKRQRELLAMIDEEEDRRYSQLEASDGTREAMLQLSYMVAARAERTEHSEDVPHKARRLYRLADLLRTCATYR
jgi:hypothetical protein